MGFTRIFRTVLMASVSLIVVLGFPQASAAAPIQVDFNVAGFGPTSGTTQSFTANNVIDDVDFTFEALDSFMNPSGLLYWDANDGSGHADGFGIMSSPGGYEDDEVEGDERLRLGFSRAISLYGFNLTDTFFEREPSVADCQLGDTDCVLENGMMRVLHENGSTTDIPYMALHSQTRSNTNGELWVTTELHNVVGMVLLAPGKISINPLMLLESSLAGVRIDATPVPEPTTLVLLSLGLAGIAGRRRIQSKRQ